MKEWRRGQDNVIFAESIRHPRESSWRDRNIGASIQSTKVAESQLNRLRDPCDLMDIIS